MKANAVPPERREAWVAKRAEEGADVLVCHPRLVQTGLDLVDFPTIVWFETDTHGDKVLEAVSGNAVQPAPVGNNPPEFDSFSTDRSVEENSDGDTPVGDPVTATDADGDALNYSLTGISPGSADLFTVDPSTGQILVAPDAVLDYEDSNPNSYSVTLTATDPSTRDDSIDVTITVTDVNESPEATGDTATTDEDTPVTIDVLTNDGDPDAGDPNDTLTVSVSAPLLNGVATVDAASNAITYTPNADFNGTETFTYQATDTAGLVGEATVVVTVNPVNDPPAFPEGPVEREVEAGAAVDTEVGDAVVATDPDGDILYVRTLGHRREQLRDRPGHGPDHRRRRRRTRPLGLLPGDRDGH